MKKISVNPGICGLKSDIIIDTDKKADIEIQIDSQCLHIQTM